MGRPEAPLGEQPVNGEHAVGGIVVAAGEIGSDAGVIAVAIEAQHRGQQCAALGGFVIGGHRTPLK